MKPLVAPVIPFEHRHALSWPSCPKCGQLCPFADVAEYVHGTIRNEWCCESCYERFETVVTEQFAKPLNYLRKVPLEPIPPVISDLS